MSEKYRFSVNIDLIAGLTEEMPETFAGGVESAIKTGADNITVHCLSLKSGAKLKEEIKMLKEQLSTADTSPEEAVVVSESPAETAEITKPETPEVKPAPTRQTAFAGKEYRPDRKKKRGKHRHSANNSDNNQTTPPAPPVANPAEDAVLPEDIEVPDTPYQFNIFDTLE